MKAVDDCENGRFTVCETEAELDAFFQNIIQEVAHEKA